MAALSLLGVIMFACFPFFMARALIDTTAARGGLIFATMPITTMLLSVCFRVERLTLFKAVAVVFATFGAGYALSGKPDQIAPNALRGDFLMVLGIFSASIFSVFSKRYLIRYGNLPVITASMAAGVTALLLGALLFERPFSGSLTLDFDGWIIVALLAIPGGAIMIGSWGKALQLISPTQAAVTIGVNPLTAILMAIP